MAAGFNQKPVLLMQGFFMVPGRRQRQTAIDIKRVLIIEQTRRSGYEKI